MKNKRPVISVIAALFLSSLLGLPADAQQSSQLHEFVAPDPSEDLSLAATTLDGNLPAAIETPSGIATAPDPTRPPDPNKLYQGGSVDDTPESTLEPDRDTQQPNIESYEDPFSPSTAPFKRLRAYDSVETDYTLRVDNRSTSVIPVGGDVNDGDESFYGDFSVELLPDELVRIPSVGPGARVLKMHVAPASTVSLLRDGAENWFIRGTERKRVRVVMQLAIARATFGSEFPNVTWGSLGSSIPTSLAHHRPQVERVMEAIGVHDGMPPREMLDKLVTYFRSFAPSTDPPKTYGDIYLDLALSKKGVCRHRAFAFLVTALEVGLPTRMVTNEAHAWVEVYDGSLWHRIDLGGAAMNLDFDLDPTRPQHEPPKDPFSWPANSNSGQDLIDRMQDQNGSSSDPGNPSNNNGSSVQQPDPNSTSTSTAPSDLPPSEIAVSLPEKAVRRGRTVKVQGKVVGEGGACKNVRVDVQIKGATAAAPRTVGSLSTDDEGAFSGTVVVPADTEAGDYDLTVVTRGDKKCGPGRSN
ncbi:MAG: transglutaminase domain-containing protein [Polyangiaceae bacterium]